MSRVPFANGQALHRLEELQRKALFPPVLSPSAINLSQRSVHSLFSPTLGEAQGKGSGNLSIFRPSPLSAQPNELELIPVRALQLSSGRLVRVHCSVCLNSHPPTHPPQPSARLSALCSPTQPHPANGLRIGSTRQVRWSHHHEGGCEGDASATENNIPRLCVSAHLIIFCVMHFIKLHLFAVYIVTIASN